MNELTIILKDSERTYRQNFLIYADYTVSENDPIIRAAIDEARECFGGEPESIQVKIHMEIQ